MRKWNFGKWFPLKQMEHKNENSLEKAWVCIINEFNYFTSLYGFSSKHAPVKHHKRRNKQSKQQEQLQETDKYYEEFRSKKIVIFIRIGTYLITKSHS